MCTSQPPSTQTSLAKEPDAEQVVGYGSKVNCSVSCGCGDSEISSVGRENLKHLKVTQGGSSGREGRRGKSEGRFRKRVIKQCEAVESMTSVHCKVGGASTFAQHKVIYPFCPFVLHR